MTATVLPGLVLSILLALLSTGSALAAPINATQLKLLHSIRDGIGHSDVCVKDHCACPAASWTTDAQTDPCTWQGVSCDAGTEARQVVELSVSFCGLTDVPDAVLQLTSLQTLDLRDNFLTALPSGFNSLEALENLYLSGNLLAALHPVVFELDLKLLHVARNLLQTVPAEIGALSWSLSEISLAYNPLGSLSKHFCELELLSNVNLAHAGLTGPLPLCLGQLTNLQRLDLSHNAVFFPVDDHGRSYPDLTNCTALEWLDLSGELAEPTPQPFALE
jgi:hypothetical protein